MHLAVAPRAPDRTAAVIALPLSRGPAALGGQPAATGHAALSFLKL
jgi:hypothetical protein